MTQTSALGTITARTVTVTAATDSKTYDGTTASAGAPSVTVGSIVAGDSGSFSQTFDNKNAGAGKTLTATGSIADGNSGNNYALTFVSDSSGVITPAGLILNAVTDSKTYDGTTSSSGLVISAGLVGGDTVSGLSQSYASKNVLGTNGSTLNVDAGYTLNDGNGGNNYTVTQNSALGTITPRAVTVAARFCWCRIGSGR